MKSVFTSIEAEASEVKKKLNRIKKDEINFQFGCNIYEFFEVVHSLFKTLGILKVGEEGEAGKTFKFISAYPDETFEETEIITYNVVRRTPFIATSKIINSKTQHHKPRFIKETFNEITGNSEDLYAVSFKNVVSFNVFSKKSRTLNNMTRVIESIFYKYSSYFKQHVDEVIFIGMNEIQFTDRYDSKDRLFSREMQYSVYTTEYFILEREQLKSIEVKEQTY